jgi:hypothetical protein
MSEVLKNSSEGTLMGNSDAIVILASDVSETTFLSAI